ncbi:MAG: replication-associated recombination protein A, partial [Aquificota bacterium]
MTPFSTEDVVEKAPLAWRLRPQNLEEFLGQRHLLSPGKPLRVMIEGDMVRSVIFYGPPGTGKT